MKLKTWLFWGLSLILSIWIFDLFFPSGLDDVVFELILHLLIGGIRFGIGSFTWALGVAAQFTMQVCILLGLLLVTHLISMAILRRRAPPQMQSWSFRQSLSCFGLVVFLITGGSAAIHVVSNTLKLSAHGGMIESGYGKITRSISNGRQLVAAVRIYASDHGGRYPEQLDELVDTEILEPESLVTLNRVHKSGEAPLPWIFLKGLNEEAPANLPLFVSPMPYTGNKYIIAYNDSTVSLQNAAEYEAAMQRWRDFRKLQSIPEGDKP